MLYTFKAILRGPVAVEKGVSTGAHVLWAEGFKGILVRQAFKKVLKLGGLKQQVFPISQS